MPAAYHPLNPYSLRVGNPAGLESHLLQGLVNCWNHSYQRMALRFNPQAPAQVDLEVVAGMSKPGETNGSRVRISAAWIRSHPQDIDVMTHEQFHVVQNYGPGAQPGWAVEGLADYARWKYGLSNAVWALPEFRADHHWTQGYGVTAFPRNSTASCAGAPTARLSGRAAKNWPLPSGRSQQAASTPASC